MARSSPVEFILDRARETARMIKCNCEECQNRLDELDTEDVILDKFIIDSFSQSPAIFFCGMFEEWTISQLAEKLDSMVSS
jgi:hypothetical protein